YQQIVVQLTDRIASGALPSGFRLPPSRTLAEELGAHRHTVARAYAELERSGLVRSTVGRGTFVGGPAVGESTEPARLPWAALLSQASEAEPLARYERLMRG